MKFYGFEIEHSGNEFSISQSLGCDESSVCFTVSQIDFLVDALRWIQDEIERGKLKAVAMPTPTQDKRKAELRNG